MDFSHFKNELECFLHNHYKGIYFSFILVKTTCHYVEVNRSYSYFPNIFLFIWRGTTCCCCCCCCCDNPVHRAALLEHHYNKDDYHLVFNILVDPFGFIG